MAFEIDMLPVGKNRKSGDCIAFRYGNLVKGGEEQTVVIVDGGYTETAEDLKTHLRKYYKCTDSSGRIHINLMILSHPDNDHVSGLVTLANDSEVIIDKVFMQCPWMMTTEFFKDGRITRYSLEKRLEEAFQKAYDLWYTLLKKQINPALPLFNFNGATFTKLGPTLKFYEECIANSEKTPKKNESVRYIPDFSINKPYGEEQYRPGHIDWYEEEHTSAINESSLIFLFEYEDIKILFTGDAGKEALRQAIDYAKTRGIDLADIDIIKMPHHGSRKNILPQIMDELNGMDTRCWISCAPGDEGHHPSKRLVNMLLEKGFKVYMTMGSTLNFGHNAPERTHFHPIQSINPYPTIER